MCIFMGCTVYVDFMEAIAKSFPETMLIYSKLDPREQILWNLNQNTNISIDENALQNVFCKMAAILLRLQCVN